MAKVDSSSKPQSIASAKMKHIGNLMHVSLDLFLKVFFFCEMVCRESIRTCPKMMSHSDKTICVEETINIKDKSDGNSKEVIGGRDEEEITT
ncbi:hypothetical protein VNO78_23795 [Psophocarpus tetragonolobus]|uniref:Uncharacterized protein n=1 Tax=Psophocarpus tetragonolobus TaxID=3891 RepID=A0AAN9XEQ8_PSOTE